MYPLAINNLPKNLETFLHLITETEGTAKTKGTSPYNVLYGYKKFNSYENHPNLIVTAGGYSSSAAGRYQILKKTFDSLKKVGTDFSPKTQDLMAIELIKRRGALKNVLDGDFKNAILKCNKEWASLPNSPYGQPTFTMERAFSYLKKTGAKIINSPFTPLSIVLILAATVIYLNYKN
jgi:lysozyme